MWPVWGAWLKVRVDVKNRETEELWGATLLIFRHFSSSRGAFYSPVIRWFVLMLVTFYQRRFGCFCFLFSWKYLGVGDWTWECKRDSLNILSEAGGLFVCVGSLVVNFHISTFLYTHNFSGGLHTEIRAPKNAVNLSMYRRSFLFGNQAHIRKDQLAV